MSEQTINENETVFNGVRYIAVPEILEQECYGCAFYNDRDACRGFTQQRQCVSSKRADERDIIWVEAEDQSQLHTPAIVEQPGEQKMRKVKWKDWKTNEEKTGLFHQWGVDYEEFANTGVGNYTVAIVELPDGKVEMVHPSRLTFVDALDKEEDHE